jgi:hypothetical protein
MIARIYDIIGHIDKLYARAKEEKAQHNRVKDNKININQAINCANEQLQKLYSSEELVQILNRFSRNNKLKHIMADLIGVERTFSAGLLSARETAEKPLELDTVTLTDLLVLRKILNKYQKQRQIIDNAVSTMEDAAKISVNLQKTMDIINLVDPRRELQTNLEIRAAVVGMNKKFMELYCHVNKFKFKFRFDDRVYKIECNPKLPKEIKKIFTHEYTTESKQDFSKLFTELKIAQVKLHAEIIKFQTALTSNNQADSDNNQNASTNKHLSVFYQLYVKLFGLPELRVQTSGSDDLNSKILCLLDPIIEDKIAEFLKHVMDPTLYSVAQTDTLYSLAPPQKPQTDDF